MDGADADNEAPEATSRHDRRSVWGALLSSDDWPVNPEHLEKMLAQAGTSCAGCRGVAHGEGVWKRFVRSGIRAKSVENFLVRDRQAIPAGSILLPAACMQVHPGVCTERDGEIYHTALTLAKRFEQHFKDMLVGEHRSRDW